MSSAHSFCTNPASAPFLIAHIWTSDESSIGSHTCGSHFFSVSHIGGHCTSLWNAQQPLTTPGLIQVQMTQQNTETFKGKLVLATPHSPDLSIGLIRPGLVSCSRFSSWIFLLITFSGRLCHVNRRSVTKLHLSVAVDSRYWYVTWCHKAVTRDD